MREPSRSHRRGGEHPPSRLIEGRPWWLGALWWLGTLIAGAASGLLAGMLVLPLALVLPEAINWPMALEIVAVFSALGIGWAGTLLAQGRAGVRLAPVLAATLATAALLSVVLVASEGRAWSSWLPNNFSVLTVQVVIIATAGVMAASRSARTEPARGYYARATLLAVGVAVAGIAATLAVASLLGLAGA